MGFVIEYVAIYAPWIYAICGLIALYQLYKIWLVRAERKQAVFSLEREKAVHDTYNIFAIAMILLSVMGGTYFTSTTLAQAVEPLLSEARSPTAPLPFPTPTNTPLPAAPLIAGTPVPPDDNGAENDEADPNAEGNEDGDGTEGDLPDGADAVADAQGDEQVIETQPMDGEQFETVVDFVEPEPEPEPEPAAPVVEAPACPDSRSAIIQPGNNATVSGVINVIGTATHDNFQFFKVEFAPGANAADGFGYLDGGNSPVISNFLISVDTFALGNGPWTLRLEVVDQTGNYIPRCQVTIYVDN